MPLIVTTSIINKKTYLMTFIAWAIIITDVIFGTFFDALGEPLTSSFGVILFITMSITVFFAGLYALRHYMVALRKDLEAPSFFNRLYKATPIFFMHFWSSLELSLLKWCYFHNIALTC
jgi:hypothetical protein